MKSIFNRISRIFKQFHFYKTKEKLCVSLNRLDQSNRCTCRLNITVNFIIEQVVFVDTKQRYCFVISIDGKLLQINEERNSMSNYPVVSSDNSPINFELLLININNESTQLKDINWNQFLFEDNSLYLHEPNVKIPESDIYKLTSTMLFELSHQNAYPFSVIELLLEYSIDDFSWNVLYDNEILPLYWINGVKATVEVFNGRYFSLAKGASLRFKIKYNRSKGD